MKNFSILGCGWLGLALANSIKKDYHLKCSVSSSFSFEKLKEVGFDAYLLNDKNLSSLDDFLACDILFINIPPSKAENYLLLLEKIYKQIPKKTKVIFISTTSVYPKKEGEYKEDFTLLFDSSNLALCAEKQVAKRTDLIFRCAGLMGYNRIAGKYFSNKTLTCAKEKVNYVHRDDVIGAIKYALKNDLEGIYNLCSPLHLCKKEIYDYNAKKYDFLSVHFSTKKDYKNRIISSDKLRKEGFSYLYSSPKDYI